MISKKAGMLKIWYQRVTSYVGIINFLMLFYLYIIEAPLGFQWYHWLTLITIVTLILLYYDIKYIYPSSLSYSFEKNPVFMELKKDTYEIKKMLEEINK